MRFFTSVYIILLIYIVSALVYWEMCLQKQNGQIYAQQVFTLRTEVDSMRQPVLFHNELSRLEEAVVRHEHQYLAEGLTFLLVILVGAGVVYKSIARRVSLSRQQNNFMLSVTHELKSPIAAIKLSLQTVQKHQLDEEKRNLLLERCIKESDRLNDLCNNMLFASQLEGRKYKPANESFDLSDLVEDTIKDYANRYPRKFEEEVTPSCMVTGDKIMLQMAINNLVENAVKYTPEHTTIQVSLATKDKTAIIRVADHGAGIPDSEKKNIFNKFYRVGNESTRKSKGTGLGLYLTQKIVQQHKGKIGVKDNRPTGSVFEICIPAEC